jgi:hypothetical protein
MPFSELTVTLAWLRANGHCECADPGHAHPGGSCRKPLDRNARGNRDFPGAWAAHVKDGNGDAAGNGHEHGNAGSNGGGPHRLLHDSVHNCEVRCAGCAI